MSKSYMTDYWDRICYYDLNGEYHNDIGPAIAYTMGNFYWYYHGTFITKCHITGFKDNRNNILDFQSHESMQDYVIFGNYVEMIEECQSIFEKYIKLKAFW